MAGVLENVTKHSQIRILLHNACRLSKNLDAWYASVSGSGDSPVSARLAALLISISRLSHSRHREPQDVDRSQRLLHRRLNVLFVMDTTLTATPLLHGEFVDEWHLQRSPRRMELDTSCNTEIYGEIRESQVRRLPRVNSTIENYESLVFEERVARAEKR